VKEGYYLLNGNQQLVLLTDYVFEPAEAARREKLPENSVIGKSIVSTDLTPGYRRSLRRDDDRTACWV